MPVDELKTVAESVDKVALAEIFFWAVAAILSWMFLKWAKEKITDWYEKREVLTGGILSDNSYYRINGCEGYLRGLRQSKDRLTLEEIKDNGEVNFHYVPISTVVGSTITKLSPQTKVEKHERT